MVWFTVAYAGNICILRVKNREIEEEIIRRYMCCMESGENVENNSAVRSGGMQQNQDPSPAKRRRQTLRTED